MSKDALHWSKVPSLNFRVQPSLGMLQEGGEDKFYSTEPTRSLVPRELRPIKAFAFTTEYVVAYINQMFRRINITVDVASLENLLHAAITSEDHVPVRFATDTSSVTATVSPYKDDFTSEYALAYRLAAFYFGLEDSDKSSPRNKRAVHLADDLAKLIDSETMDKAKKAYADSLVSRL